MSLGGIGIEASRPMAAPRSLEASGTLALVTFLAGMFCNRTGPEILEFLKPEMGKPDRTGPKFPTTTEMVDPLCGRSKTKSAFKVYL